MGMQDIGFGSIEDLIQKPQSNNTQQTASDDANSSRNALQDAAAKAAQGEDNTAEAAQSHLNEKMEEIRLRTLEDETKAKASLLSMSYIDLEAFPIGPEVISLIPEEEAREHKIITFFRLENQIRVAVVDPDDPAVHDIIANLQGRHEGAQIKLYLISQHSFDSAFKLYRSVAKVKTVEYGVRITAEDLDRFAKELTDYDIFAKRLQEVNMTEAFAMIIAMALNVGTSDIHIEAGEREVHVRFRIDGVLTIVATLPQNMQSRLVNRIKAIAELKINVSEIPQDGRITIKLGEDDKLDIRVSTLPSAFGESVVFRLLKSSSVGLSFEDLGMRPKTFERLKEQIEKPNGMIITTGPTGSGKTTTLYAILNKLNSPENKIITLENPIEYKLAGIVQSQVDHTKKYTFAMGLRAILRQDPDIVMVGEIRDLETAKTAVEAALTGHLMLSTIHTNDAAGAIPRFLGMGIQGIFLAPALNAVIGQRLVRRICKDCTQPYTPPKEQLDKMQEWINNIPEKSGEEKPDVSQVEFLKGAGCSTCADTGYKGRVGIYEVFTMSAGIEQQVLGGNVSEYEMKKLLHEAGMVTMGQDGLLKVVDGMTTLDEVFRVAKG